MLLDMPLDQLKRYRGTNPRPEDFDAYWDRALDQMHALDREIAMTPALFQAPGAECFDLTFTGVGGARVYAQYLRPERTRGPHPAVVMFHGYGGSSGDFASKLAYVNAGFSVAALDCRGQGGRSQDLGGVCGNTHHGHIIRGVDGAPEDLLFRSIFLDAAELAGIVMDIPEVDSDRVGVFGGSQGGGLALACAALEPRIARVVSFFPFLCDYQRVWEMDLAKDAYGEIQEYFRFYDPAHQRQEAFFTRLGYIDVSQLAPRIRGKVQMHTGLMDSVCPPSTQFAAYNAITAPKKMILYPDYGHEEPWQARDAAYQFLMKL